MRMLFLLGLSLFWVPAQADGQTTQTLRVQWEQSGPMASEGAPRPPFTVAMAQGYVYKLYKFNDPSSGLVLTGVTCTTTTDPFTKTCTVSPVPMGYDAVGQALDMTAVVMGIETAHSNQATVPPPFQPPGPPTNLRFISVPVAALLTPFKALGSLR